MGPLAAGEDRSGDLLDREIGIPIGFATERRTQH